LYILF